ncbi:MAG: Flp pilus assembly protein TadD, contains TPR repeat, partial [uncultured Sphingomonadaceae bacterium]
ENWLVRTQAVRRRRVGGHVGLGAGAILAADAKFRQRQDLPGRPRHRPGSPPAGPHGQPAEPGSADGRRARRVAGRRSAGGDRLLRAGGGDRAAQRPGQGGARLRAGAAQPAAGGAPLLRRCGRPRRAGGGHRQRPGPRPRPSGQRQTRAARLRDRVEARRGSRNDAPHGAVAGDQRRTRRRAGASRPAAPQAGHGGMARARIRAGDDGRHARREQGRRGGDDAEPRGGFRPLLPQAPVAPARGKSRGGAFRQLPWRGAADANRRPVQPGGGRGARRAREHAPARDGRGIGRRCAVGFRKDAGPHPGCGGSDRHDRRVAGGGAAAHLGDATRADSGRRRTTGDRAGRDGWSRSYAFAAPKRWCADASNPAEPGSRARNVRPDELGRWFGIGRQSDAAAVSGPDRIAAVQRRATGGRAVAVVRARGVLGDARPGRRSRSRSPDGRHFVRERLGAGSAARRSRGRFVRASGSRRAARFREFPTRGDAQVRDRHAACAQAEGRRIAGRRHGQPRLGAGRGRHGHARLLGRVEQAQEQGPRPADVADGVDDAAEGDQPAARRSVRVATGRAGFREQTRAQGDYSLRMDKREGSDDRQAGDEI